MSRDLSPAAVGPGFVFMGILFLVVGAVGRRAPYALEIQQRLQYSSTVLQRSREEDLRTALGGQYVDIGPRQAASGNDASVPAPAPAGGTALRVMLFSGILSLLIGIVLQAL